MIYGGGFGAGGHARKFGDAFNTSDFHLVVDVCGAHIQCTSENEREAKHVVHLVGKVRPPRRDNRFWVHRTGGCGVNFGVRVGKRKDDRRVCHFGDHFGLQNTGARKAKKQISAVNHITKRCSGGALGIVGFLRGHILGSAIVNKAFNIT